jgi:hypothetical protein
MCGGARERGGDHGTGSRDWKKDVGGRVGGKGGRMVQMACVRCPEKAIQPTNLHSIPMGTHPSKLQPARAGPRPQKSSACLESPLPLSYPQPEPNVI